MPLSIGYLNTGRITIDHRRAALYAGLPKAHELLSYGAANQNHRAPPTVPGHQRAPAVNEASQQSASFFTNNFNEHECCCQRSYSSSARTWNASLPSSTRPAPTRRTLKVPPFRAPDPSGQLFIRPQFSVARSAAEPLVPVSRALAGVADR